MLEAMSCWKVDWTALGAVGTMLTCAIALGLARRDQRRVVKREVKLGLAAGELLAAELIQMQMAASQIKGDAFSWAFFENPVGYEEMRRWLSPTLLHQAFYSMHELPEETLSAMARVISSAQACHGLAGHFTDPNFKKFIGEEKAMRQIKSAAIDLHTRVTQLLLHFGTKGEFD